MKYKHVVILVFIILLLDQALKFYIKTNFIIGQQSLMAGTWAQLYFIENEGMAFGLKFGGEWGKLALTLFRLAACIWGFVFIHKLAKQKVHSGLLFCAGLILAGALGNLIDSVFYGMIFTETGHMKPARLVPWGQGYGKLFHGRVVDMLYFPIIQNKTWPSWVPLWGGTSFEFFRPIFNLADFAISSGVITLLVFQKTLLHNFMDKKESEEYVIPNTEMVINSEKLEDEKELN